VSAAPTPGWPVDPSPATGPAWPQGGRASPREPAPVHLHRAASERVTVRSGDSLWLIARRRRGPAATDEQIATAWPRWYAANRTTVGADPGLIHPGQTLHAP